MNKKYAPVKLEDLAKKLKVSTVTISKALRDHPDISLETRDKVKKLADKMGYQPNLMARNLSSRHSYTIGLVVPRIAHVFFSTVIESVYDTAFRYNYEIVLMESQEKEINEKKHIQSLLSMKVDGLIISVTQETKDLEIFQKVVNSKLPLVFIDRIPPIPYASSIESDDFCGAFSATEYAITKGYTKIGHIGGGPHVNIGKNRYDGFIAAMKKHKVPVNRDWVTQGGCREEDGYDSFMKMYRKGKLPQHILAVTHSVALGVYAAALEVGIKIPGDIEVSCFGKNNFGRFIPSTFNVIELPAAAMGEEAVKLVLEQVKDKNNFVPKKVQLKTKLVLGEAFTQKLTTNI